jgi:enamine deaminase RidA (YjgF/YER057c/UK114 family)
MQILQPPHWKTPRGYANGIAARGRMVFIGGQIGWDETETFRRTDFIGQVEQALKNVVAILAEAGGRPEHIARMTWYVVDKKEYLASLKELGGVYRAVLGRHFPAMTAVEVSALIEDLARVEIECTAVIPDNDEAEAA